MKGPLGSPSTTTKLRFDVGHRKNASDKPKSANYIPRGIMEEALGWFPAAGDYQHPRLMRLGEPGEEGLMLVEYKDILRQARGCDWGKDKDIVWDDLRKGG